MNLEDIKLYTLSIGTMAITMTQIDNYLKILLLLITIGYTLHKWIHLKKKEK
tara:strand:- start:476 stop:631 length:156 start_codon:yes stop_codon:yes gene_type:complete